MNQKKRFVARLGLVILSLGVIFAMLFKPSELLGKKLDVKRGVVSTIQKEVEERITGDPHDAATRDLKMYTYIAKFDLNGAPIVAKFQEPYQINEGDRLTVCGVQTETYFDVIAYRNETLHYTGSNVWWMMCLAGIVFALFGGFLFFKVIQEPQWYEQAFFLGVFGVSRFLVIRGLFIKEALELLNQS